MSKLTQTITNRFSREVMYTADIECSDSQSPALRLGLAVKVAVEERADLRRANLRGAVLWGADLRGVNLQGADLRDEKITRLVGRVVRLTENHEFFAFEMEAGGYKILAGCRWFSDAEFRAHVAAEYPGTDKATETLAILNFLKARAKAVGVGKTPKVVGPK